MRTVFSIVLAIATIFTTLASTGYNEMPDTVATGVSDREEARGRDSLQTKVQEPSVAADTAYNPYRFGWKQLIAPATLITVGTVGMEAGWFKDINNGFSPVDPHDVSKPLDDVIQYTPIAGLYALKLCGVRSRDSYVDISLLLAMSWMISAGTVRCLKHTVSVWRPDGTTDNSFPSGHTATAFMGAEMIRMEYGDNPWVAYSGYAVAAATGALRIHHKRHWLTDVLVGAGIGILSTRLAYWLYPYVTRYLIPPLYRRNVYLSAFGTPVSAGVSFAMRF